MIWVNKLRPAKGAPAAALSAKLAEAERQAAALAATVADMEDRRGAMLLDGTAADAEVMAADVALATARDELAAVAAVTVTLAERATAADTSAALAWFRAEVASHPVIL